MGNFISENDYVIEDSMDSRDESTVKFSGPSPILSAKIESDPVLIRKIFENHQSDPVLAHPCKTKFYYFASWGKI